MIGPGDREGEHQESDTYAERYEKRVSGHLVLRNPCGQYRANAEQRVDVDKKCELGRFGQSARSATSATIRMIAISAWITPKLGRSRDTNSATTDPASAKKIRAIQESIGDLADDLLRRFRIFRRLHVEAGIGIDEAEVVMHLLDAGRILSGHNRGLTGLVGCNDAVEVDDPVPDRHLEADRAPVGRVDGTPDAIANMVVVGRRIRDLVGDTRDSLEQV